MDYVFGNETEARTFSKVHGWEVMVSLTRFTYVYIFVMDLNVAFYLNRPRMLKK